MSKDIFQNIITHLEFYGYTVQEKDVDEYKSTFCRHEEYGPLLLREAVIGVFFEAFYNSKLRNKKSGSILLEKLNAANRKSWITTFTMSDEGSIQMRALYTGLYDKAIFRKFIEKWHVDSELIDYDREIFEDLIKIDKKGG